LVLLGGGSELFFEGLGEGGQGFKAGFQVNVAGSIATVYQGLCGMIEALCHKPTGRRASKVLFEGAFKGRQAHVAQKSQFGQRQALQFVPLNNGGEPHGRRVGRWQQGIDDAGPLFSVQVEQYLFALQGQQIGLHGSVEGAEAAQTVHEVLRKVVVSAGLESAVVVGGRGFELVPVDEVQEPRVGEKEQGAVVVVLIGRKGFGHQAPPGAHEQKVRRQHRFVMSGVKQLLAPRLQKAKRVAFQFHLVVKGSLRRPVVRRLHRSILWQRKVFR